mgnify:CR=1 FL=1
MGKKIKFKFKKLDYNNKVLVYLDYIDRDFFNTNFSEDWKYNKIDFNIVTYMSIGKGDLSIEYNDNGKITSFNFYIGTKENYFIVNKNEIKIFKDLENIVYNDVKRPLSSYLENNKYYYITLVEKYLKYDVDVFSFDGDDIDKNYFLSGNMFRTKKEVEKIVKKLNNGEITIKEIKEGRKNFIKNYSFE